MIPKTVPEPVPFGVPQARDSAGAVRAAVRRSPALAGFLC